MSVKNWTASGTVTPFEAGVADPGTTAVSFTAGMGEPANGISSTAIVRVSHHGAIDIRNTSTQPVAFTLTTQGWFAPTATQIADGRPTHPSHSTSRPCAPTSTSALSRITFWCV